jgi:hypothetical protein
MLGLEMYFQMELSSLKSIVNFTTLLFAYRRVYGNLNMLCPCYFIFCVKITKFHIIEGRMMGIIPQGE